MTTCSIGLRWQRRRDSCSGRVVADSPSALLAQLDLEVWPRNTTLGTNNYRSRGTRLPLVSSVAKITVRSPRLPP